MTEYEKKILLTKEEYLLIHNKYSNTSDSTVQVNNYYDTPDYLMNKMGITCRIRKKDGLFQTTVKKHNKQLHGLSDEENIGKKTEFLPLTFEMQGLTFQGNLTTLRTVLFKDEHCEMVLDLNIYLDTVDYEIEVEYHNGYERQALKLIDDIAEILMDDDIALKNAFLSRIGKGKSKSERFFERKQKMG